MFYFCKMSQPDLFTISTIRSLSKKQRRMRREKFNNKFENQSFIDQLHEQQAKQAAKERQDKINDLLQDIKALQLIGADTTNKKQELNRIFKDKK